MDELASFAIHYFSLPCFKIAINHTCLFIKILTIEHSNFLHWLAKKRILTLKQIQKILCHNFDEWFANHNNPKFPHERHINDLF